MNWASVSDFIHMGGHGYYVWCAYGMMLALCVGEVIALRARRNKAINRLMREARAQRAAREI